MTESQILEFLARVAPIIGFLIAISIVVNLCSRAGVFEVVAQHLSRYTVGRPWRLWLAVSALTTVSTVFLSLDTAAVIITPLAIAMAATAGVDRVPILLTVVVLANTTSLLLPVSNLTNLLVANRGTVTTPAEYLRVSAAPALVAILASMLVLAWRFRKLAVTSSARAGGEVPEAAGALPMARDRFDRPRLRACALVLAVLLPVLATPVPYWISATVAAVLLLGVFAVRGRREIRLDLVPWRIIALATALVSLAQLAYGVGLRQLLQAHAVAGESAGEILSLSGVAAALSNVVNNLPAYLLLEPAGNGLNALFAILIGANAGSIILPWGSLATLLWQDQLRRNGAAIPWSEFVRTGIRVVPVVVVLAALTHAVTLPAG